MFQFYTGRGKTHLSKLYALPMLKKPVHGSSSLKESFTHPADRSTLNWTTLTGKSSWDAKKTVNMLELIIPRLHRETRP
jgi:hypothetical protein